MRFSSQLAPALCVCLLAAPAFAADRQKADNTDALNLGSSWVGASAPGTGDNALWDNTVAVNTTSSLGGNLLWSGILMGYATAGAENQPAASIVINGDGLNTLTLGVGGINLRGTTSQSTPARPNLTINADVILGAAQTWTLYGFSRVLTVDGMISGAFNLTKASGGQLTLLRSNSFGNLNITGGTVNIGNGGSDGTLGTGVVNLGNGTALIFNRSDDLIITNNFTGGSGSLVGGRFEKRGAGTLTLGGERPSFFGTCKLTAGTLVITNETQLGTNVGGAALVANALEFNNGTLRAAESFVIDDSKRGIQLDTGTTGNMNVDSGKTLTISNAITGAGSLRKQGNGVLLLAAANNYSGTTTNSSGTLIVDGSLASGSTVTVSGGVLGGSGSIGGAVTIQSGGTVTPGNSSIATLTFGSAPTLSGTALMEINRNSGSPVADKIAGGAAMGGTLTVTNLGAALQVGDTFDLFDGAITGTLALTNLPHGNLHWNTAGLAPSGDGTIAFINSAPTAQNLTAGVTLGGSVTLSVVGGKHPPADAEGDNMTVTAVGSASSGTASIIGGTNISYTSTTTATGDSFTYTVSDGFGGTDTKTVSVVVSAAEGFNKLSGPTGSGPYSFSYLGIPSHVYELQETADLPVTGSSVWSTVATETASPTGAVNFIGVSLSYPFGSFRTRHVP